MTEQDHRCRQGARCRSRVRDGEQFVGAGVERPGLCALCEETAFAAIRRLSDDYATLDAALSEPRAGADQGPYVKRSAEHGIPIRLDCDAIATAIVTEVIRWVRVVGFDDDLPVSAAECVDRCVTLLGTRLGTLVDLPGRPHAGWRAHPDGGDDPVDVVLDGVDAVLRLADLHRQAQRALGLTETRTWLPDPCPHCGRRALAASKDQNHVTCSGCGIAWDADHFAHLGNVLEYERGIA